jgi:CRISPR-associated endonuclease Cas3-HD
MNLVDRMNKAVAKSLPRVSLFEHSFGVLQIVDHMIRQTEGYSDDQASVLRLGAFLHDIGKLNEDFQAMLYASDKSQVKRVKHEAQTYQFYEDVMNERNDVVEWLAEALNCRVINPKDWGDVFAFAVTHHGLFYSSLEEGKWHARREWTRMSPNEERRITLADLLIRYYPLGGAVIFADMLHSEQLSSGRDNVSDIKGMKHPSDWLLYIRRRKEELFHVKEIDHETRIPLDLLELLIA